MDRIEIGIPPVEMIEACWDDLVPFLELAIGKSNGELNLGSIKEGIKKGEIILLPIFDAGKLISVVSFELTTFASGKKVLHIMTAGGEKSDSWYERIDQIANEMAKSHGCSEIYIIGRKGWERKMKHLNYRHVHTIIARGVN